MQQQQQQQQCSLEAVINVDMKIVACWIIQRRCWQFILTGNEAVVPERPATTVYTCRPQPRRCDRDNETDHSNEPLASTSFISRPLARRDLRPRRAQHVATWPADGATRYRRCHYLCNWLCLGRFEEITFDEPDIIHLCERHSAPPVCLSTWLARNHRRDICVGPQRRRECDSWLTFSF